MKKQLARHPRVWNFLALLLLFGIFVGLDLGFRALYPYSGTLTGWGSQPILFTLLWSLLLCGLGAALPTLARRIYSVAMVAFWSLSLLVHGGMYSIFGTFFSFADLSYAEDGAAFFSLSYVTLRKKLVLLVAAAVVVALVLAILQPKLRYSLPQALAGVLMVAVAVTGLFVLNARCLQPDDETFTWEGESLTDSPQRQAQVIYTSFTDTNRCFYMTGCYQYLFRSFMLSSGLSDKLNNGKSDQQLTAYYQAQADHEDNDMTGLYEGKNAILVLLESIDTWLLTEEYMPNLYALQQSSLNCVDHYSPMFISAGTFGTEFTVNTGLIPPTAGVRNEAYSTYTFPNSLAALFEEKGYTANSFHSSNPTIYDRGIIHENWGYEAYHSYVEMGMEDYQLDSQMINGYDQMVSDDPFFTFILTYSGHGPYTEELGNISAPHWEAATAAAAQAQLPADISEADYEEYVNAVAHAMETDAFIGELVDALTADGHMEDTVLIFFTDHYCKYMSNTDLVMELKGSENTDFLNQVPFFIYSADTPAATITKPTSSIDIAPTIANLFNLNATYAYFPGNDIFGDDGGYVIFRGPNWYDGEIYYSADYDGEITDEIRARNTQVQTSVNMAWTALKSNYFGRISQE